MAPPNTALNPEVLLVDDDELVTRSLCRYLRSARPHWQIRTASSGSTALQALRLNPADVCISDVQMTGMNGFELLDEVSSQWPTTIRILYCGDFEQTRRIDGGDVAHQVLSKSTDPNQLIDAIDQALQASLSLTDRTVWRLLAKDHQLPSAPTVFPALEAALERPHIRMQDLTSIISRDEEIVRSVLEIAGCAWLGLPAHLRTLDGAVGWLGLQTVRGLVLHVESFRGFANAALLSLRRLRAQSFRVAELAARIARDTCPSEAANAYLAGTVHDIGRVVLASRAEDAYAHVLEHVRLKRVPLCHAERTLMGTTHADLGAALLDFWGLPVWLSSAVRAHHVPPTTSRWNAASALFAACTLIEEADGGRRASPRDWGALVAPESAQIGWREMVGLRA